MSDLSVLREKAEMFERRAERERRIPSLSDTTKRWPLTIAGCSWNISTWNRMKQTEFRLPRLFCGTVNVRGGHGPASCAPAPKSGRVPLA